jgi:hypothetical protein
MFRNYKLNDEQKREKKKDEQYIANKNSNVGKVNNSRSFNRIKKVRNVASHVGFGFNNRDMIFVENNAIIQKSILYNKKKINEIISPELQRQELINDMFSIKRNENTRISAIFQPILSSHNSPKLNQNNVINKLKEKNHTEDENGLDYLTFIDRGKMDEKQLIAFYKKARRRVCLKLDEIEHTTNFRNYENYKNSKPFKMFIKSQNKKKKNKFNLTDTNFYNRNNRNQIQKINSALTLNNEKEKKMNLLNMEAEYQNLMGKSPPQSTNRTITYLKTEPNFKKIQSLKLNTYRSDNRKNDKDEDEDEDNNNYLNENKNNARSRIKQMQEKWKEYDQLSPEQRQRREFLESKKKWVSKEDFHRVFGLHTTAIKPIPNVMSYGKPVTDYKFREINHEKWLTPNGFV